MSIPISEGLQPLPDVPDVALEEQRAAEFAERHMVAVYRARKLCAAEYGFASWDNLVGHFRMCEAHSRAGTSRYNLEQERANREVASLLKDFNSRKDMTEAPPDSMGHLAAVATYIPRLYGLSDEELRSETLAESEAQYVVARRRRFMSWRALSEKNAEMLKYRAPEYQRPKPEKMKAMEDAKVAVSARSIDGLTRAFEAIPNWFEAADGPGYTISPVWLVIAQLIKAQDDGSRALLDHLYSLGVNVQSYLDCGLVGTGYSPVATKEIRGLLQLGANVNQTFADGHSLLEHAVAKYMNGDAVDLIASRAPKQRSFWLAAGLGDLEGVRSFIGSDGRPTIDAIADRVDNNAMDSWPAFARSPRPNAPDNEIVWEAFQIAAQNFRPEVMSELLAAGFPIDYSPTPENALLTSVRHQLVPTVEYLLSRGADPHYKSWPTHWSALYMSKVSQEHYPERPGVSEIHALLTGGR